MLKNHLDMIGRNEPVQRKAKFWQSYVRALKGTDDMRAPEQSHYSRLPSRGVFRPILNVDYPTWPSIKSIYDDPINPSERINVPGYRYLPISRETYGISPRNIHPHNYSSPRYEPLKRDPPFKALNDWNDHLNRLAELDSIFPKKYLPLHRAMSPARETYAPKSRPKSIFDDPLRAYGYNYAGQPIHIRHIPSRPLRELFEPNTHVPISRFVRDPWWWDYPELKPYEPPHGYHGHTPSHFYLRNSYLSPVKRTYLWGHHPMRPLSTHNY